MRVIEMKKQKKTHVHARHIMTEIFKCRTEWDFGNAGRNPKKVRSDWLRISRHSPQAVPVIIATPSPEEVLRAPLESDFEGIPSSIPMLSIFTIHRTTSLIF